MAHIQRLAIAVVAVVGISCGSVWAGKVAVDPNKSVKAAPGLVQTTEDARLQKKITYTSGGKTLRAVVEDISRLGGVTVYCGQGKNDWRVRDIPVVVSVKDLPLGTLLRALADATHTHLASEANGNQMCYRIYRRSVDEASIDSFFESRHAARLKAAQWQWDALVAYGKSKPLPDLPKQTWLLGKLLGSLGDDAKQKMLSGEVLQLGQANAAVRGDVDELYQLVWQEMKRGASRESAPLPSEEDLSGAVLKLKLIDTGATGDTRVQAKLTPVVYDSVWTYWTTDLSDARSLEGRGLNLPEYPKEVTAPDLEKDMDDPKMTLIKPSWDHPLVQASINMERPKDLKNPRFCDLICQFAEASGLNIVTEDFSSHCGAPYQQVDGLYASKILTANVLRLTDSLTGHTGYTWFASEPDKLLVGWASSRNRWSWRDQHRNMLPQSLLVSLKSKYEGDGLELDDVIPLMSIPTDAFDEWIRNSRDYTFLNQIQSALDPAWQLYDALESADKSLAKSEEGLPLMKFDPNWIKGFFQAQRRQLPIESEIPKKFKTTEADEKKQQELIQRDRATSDAKIISTMVMRIVKKPAEGRWYVDRGWGRIPAGLDLSAYEMLIDYKMDGASYQMKVYGPPYGFPMRSPEREAEILNPTAQNKENK